MKQENYYGIKFNDDIPLIDKINEFNKSVEIKFIGKAFIVNRKDETVCYVQLRDLVFLANKNLQVFRKKRGNYEEKIISTFNVHDMHAFYDSMWWQ